MKRIYALIVCAVMFTATMSAQYEPNKGGDEVIPYYDKQTGGGWTGDQPEGWSAYQVVAPLYIMNKTTWHYDVASQSTKIELNKSKVDFMFPPQLTKEASVDALTIKFDWTADDVEISDTWMGAPLMSFYAVSAFTDHGFRWNPDKFLGAKTDPTVLYGYINVERVKMESGDPNARIQFVVVNEEVMDREFEWELPGLAGLEKINYSICYFASKGSSRGDLTFKNIRIWDSTQDEPEPNSIETANQSGFSAYGTQNGMIAKGQEGAVVEIRNVLGQTVKAVTLTSSDEQVTLPSGLYLISSNGKTVKVAVK